MKYAILNRWKIYSLIYFYKISQRNRIVKKSTVDHVPDTVPIHDHPMHSYTYAVGKVDY